MADFECSRSTGTLWPCVSMGGLLMFHVMNLHVVDTWAVTGTKSAGPVILDPVMVVQIRALTGSHSATKLILL